MIGVTCSCDPSQKLNKKTDVIPQTLAGEDDSRKSRESSGWPRLHTFILPSHGGTTWNLASIGQAVSKEKKFENVNLSDLGPRSVNDLDLWYSYRFIYSFS